MAIFDPAMFGLLARGMADGQPQGGLLDFLRDPSRLAAMAPSSGFGDQLPPSAQPAQGQMNLMPDRYVPVGDYQMPQFGSHMPQQPAPQPPQANAQMQAVPQSQGAGLGGNFMAGLNNLNSGGNPITMLANVVDGFATGQRHDKAGLVQKQQNMTIQALRARGVSEPDIALAASNPEILKALLPRLWPQMKPHNVGNTVGAWNEATGNFSPQYSEPKTEKVAPGETLYSVSPGGAKAVVSGGPEKPPAGYKYVDGDPSKGLQAIPGGPATQISAEAAGRIAMMEAASADLPKAREVLLRSRSWYGATGTDGVAGTLGMGEMGRAQRTVRTAIEGALRAMTGAAAPETEVTRYEGMFMPGPLDSPETATQKLNQLTDFIMNARRLVTQGRGPAGNEPSVRASDPLGIR